jgi:hypothetical protein
MMRAVRAPLGATLVLMCGALAAGTAAAGALPLALVALTSPVRVGHDARMTVQTAPDVECILLVYYRSSAGDVDLSFPKRADRKGLVTWTWRVSPAAVPGTWPLIVHCTDSLKGNVQQRRLEIPFVVR